MPAIVHYEKVKLSNGFAVKLNKLRFRKFYANFMLTAVFSLTDL